MLLVFYNYYLILYYLIFILNIIIILWARHSRTPNVFSLAKIFFNKKGPQRNELSDQK